MSLIYITGPTGSGKSTICEKLNKLGYETYDTDKAGIRHWLNSETGEPVKIFEQNEFNDKSDLNYHLLGLPKSWLENLKSKSKDRPVFVCGTSPIDHTESGIYDKIILLKIDEDTLIKRVTSRNNNEYGKNPEQLNKAIKWRQATIERYRQAGAYEIDGTLNLDKIINKILSLVSPQA